MNISSVSKQFVSTKKKLTESWYSQIANKRVFQLRNSSFRHKSPDLGTRWSLGGIKQLRHSRSVSLVLPQLDVLTLCPGFVNDYDLQLVSLHILHICGLA